MTPFEISHWKPETKDPSSIRPADHHPALFLIQSGIEGSACTDVDPLP